MLDIPKFPELHTLGEAEARGARLALDHVHRQALLMNGTAKGRNRHLLSEKQRRLIGAQAIAVAVAAKCVRRQLLPQSRR